MGRADGDDAPQRVAGASNSARNLSYLGARFPVRLRLTPLIAALAFALVPTAHAGITPRIVGGRDAPAGAYPSMAALVVPGFVNDADGTFCGATVIAPYAFVTAAHCIIQDQPSPHTLGPGDLIVATGRTDLSVPGGQRLAVRKIVTHPNFDTPYALANDVAVVLTTAPTTSAPALRASAAAGRGRHRHGARLGRDRRQTRRATTRRSSRRRRCRSSRPTCASTTA